MVKLVGHGEQEWQADQLATAHQVDDHLHKSGEFFDPAKFVLRPVLL